MIVVIDKPDPNHPEYGDEYHAWTVDAPHGVILGTGKTIDETKADFFNSIDEMREGLECNEAEWIEYFKEEAYFYLRID